MTHDVQFRSEPPFEDFYRLLFEQAQEGILITDQEGNLLECNESAHAALGYSREEFARLDLTSLNTATDSLEAELYRHQLEDRGHCCYPLRQKDKNGVERSVLVSIRKLLLAGRTVYRTTWQEDAETNRALEESLATIRQLAEEKARAEAIIDAIGEGISIRDRDFRLIYQNRANLDLVGDRIGEFCYAVYHGRDHICENCPVAQSFEDGQIHVAKNLLETGPSREYFELTASPLKDAAGNIVAGLELTRNISAKEKAEQALQEANVRMEVLLHAIPDMVIFKDANGRHLMVNRAAEKIIGIPQDDFLGKTMEELSSPEVACHCRATDERAMRSLQPVHFEEEMHDASGEPLFLDTIKAPIQDKAGNLLGVIMVSRNITERKRVEEKIKESEKRLRDITANLGIGLYVTDTRGKIVFMNPMAEQLWGWSLDDLRESGVHELLHFRRKDGSALPADECELMKVMASGQPYTSAEENFVRKDGAVFPVSVICTPLYEDDRIVAVVTAFRDITAEKNLEAELLKVQKLESVGFLAGGIAHDFNNILQGLLASISLARLHLEQGSKERVLALLQKAEEATEVAKELSFRLLTFAKGGNPVRTSTSLEEIVKKSISLSLSGSSIECTVELPADLPPILVDGGQMMQVFNNILINAKEAMPRGGAIYIGAKRVRVEEDSVLPLKVGEYLCVSVRDSGCGIPAENIDRIFDPYFSKKGKGRPKGSGLGLSICLAIVRKHEGHISVESELDRGTTFHLHMGISDEQLPVREASEENQLPLPHRRILFMDDDAGVLELVGEMMTSLGCEVDCAMHGEEAISLYKKALGGGRPYGGVVLDLTVKGGIGGEETIARLLEIDPRVKAVISSGYADNPVIKNFREYGFLDALAKPFNLGQLKKLLAKLPEEVAGEMACRSTQ